MTVKDIIVCKTIMLLLFRFVKCCGLIEDSAEWSSNVCNLNETVVAVGPFFTTGSLGLKTVHRDWCVVVLVSLVGRL